MKVMEVDVGLKKMVNIAKQSMKNRKDVIGMGVFKIGLASCAQMKEKGSGVERLYGESDE